MKIDRIKELIDVYEWMADEPSPEYAELILNYLYALFLERVNKEDVYPVSNERKIFEPDLDELDSLIRQKEISFIENPSACLARDVKEALTELKEIVKNRKDK